MVSGKATGTAMATAMVIVKETAMAMWNAIRKTKGEGDSVNKINLCFSI
jgi:hypothetical protein